MASPSPEPNDSDPRWLERERLQALFDVLRAEGYKVVGPTVQQGAIVYDQIDSVAELPAGWTDQQQPGQYRLTKREDQRLFGYNLGPHSWKQFLFPPQSIISTAERTAAGWRVESPEDAEPPLALIGVRACELAAIAVQDRVFLQPNYVDPIYARRRERACLVAVDCGQSASTCFCVSMNTGPRCRSGFDLALTELDTGFLVQTGSPRGAAVLAQLETRPANDSHHVGADAERDRAVEQQSRAMPDESARRQLRNHLEHPRWEEVSQRCLSCTNCTQVCPTCFCSSVREVSDLDATHASRERVWDSCFNFDLSYMNGGVVRNSIRSRYRQWLTHKLDTWHDQFDVSGCVGCGRCIAWCPVGIDLIEEVTAIVGVSGAQP